MKRSLEKATQHTVVIKTNGTMYRDDYEPLDLTAKNVLSALLVFMDTHANTIQIGGDTLEELLKRTKYSEGTIRKALVRLNKIGLAEKTGLRGEYIVNPLFAIKGSEDKVWDMYKLIEVQRTLSQGTRIHNG